MTVDRKLDDEAGRIAAVLRYDVLDTPPEAPFEVLTKLARDVLDVPIAAVTLIDADRQWFKSIAGLNACETARDVSFCTYTIKQRKPLVIPDATMDVRFYNNPLVTGDPWIRSYLGIPLETPDGYNLGALCAIDTKPRNFSSSEITNLTTFAKLVLNELELRQIATSDPLTGCMTRRAWSSATEKEFARSRRYGTDASIILLDVDHFKKINDIHGHATGDAVLRILVQRCFGILRECDMLGRLGGEEFAILLPHANAEEAFRVGERLRMCFANTPIEVPSGALQVTASFGICSLQSGIDTVDTWIATADGYLYQAKRRGRNCCKGNTEITSLSDAG